MKRQISESDQSINIDEANDAALWAELGAVVKSLHKLVDVLHFWCFTKKLNSFLVEGLWFFFNILFFAEKVKVTFFVESFAGRLVVEHLRMNDCSDCRNYVCNVWSRN